MKSMYADEGYLMIDHRACGGKLEEAGTYTCGHCERVVVKNPLRVRERGYCKKCSGHLCDTCTAVMAQTLECADMEKTIEEVLENAVRSINLKGD